MLFRKLLLGVLTLGLALTGLVFGALFVLCLSLYILWHGLSASVFVFGTLCVACTMMTLAGLRRTRSRDESQLTTREARLPAEEASERWMLGARGATLSELKRRKIQ